MEKHLPNQMSGGQQKTLVMVPHDAHLAEYADRIFHIRDGKILKIEERKRTQKDKAQKQIQAK